MVEKLDFSEQDLEENRKLLDAFSRMRNLDIRTVNWFVPHYDQAYAGIHTILRFASYFQSKKAIKNRIIFYDGPERCSVRVKSKVIASFPELSDAEILILEDEDVNALPECDAAIATLWTSAYRVLEFNKTKGKFYFIQDYEPLFYPASSLYALAEATYRFGFCAIVNTPGLLEACRPHFTAPAKCFVPAVDEGIFYPPTHRDRDREFRLFFYGRPSSPRNAFEIGMTVVKRLKEKWGDRLRVDVAGSPDSAEFRRYAGIVSNHGLLPYVQTGELYRRCDAGLVLMLSKHPSYLPFELMSCGAAVVSNRNPANSWLFRDRENCLITEPSVSCVVDRVSDLIRDPSLLRRLSEGGLKTVSGYSWEEQMEQVFQFISRRDQS